MASPVPPPRPQLLRAGPPADPGAVRAAGVPYLVVAGDDLGAVYRGWLTEMLPHATVTVWPGNGHFPHIAHPGRFAACLAAAGPAGSSHLRIQQRH
jgi:pimeloyl-ACP methyl ester carboxylesterase